MRTQQIILHESGVTNVTDPLAGRYYMEWLTSEMEKKAYEILDQIDAMGGFVKVYESGWLREQIAEESRMDAHDRGVRSLAKEFSNAGMEVIFTRYGLPEEIVSMAIQEAADVIEVSSSTGGHLYVAQAIRERLNSEGIDDIKVIFGGIIPNQDIPKMKKAGVDAIFGPGSSLEQIIGEIDRKKSWEGGLGENPSTEGFFPITMIILR